MNIAKKSHIETTISGLKKFSHDVIELKLTRPEGFSYAAGQYIWLILPSLVNSHETIDRHAFSLACESSAKELCLLIRLTPSRYHQELKKLEIGGKVSIDGPYGYTFQRPPKHHVVALAGGIGVSPFVSLAIDAKNKPHEHNLSIHHYIGDKPSDYVDDFKKIVAGTPHLSYAQHRGQLTAKDFPEVLDDNTAVFISGPQDFNDAAYATLRKMGFKSDCIHFEENYPSADQNKVSQNLSFKDSSQEAEMLRALEENLKHKPELKREDFLKKHISKVLILGIATSTIAGFERFVGGHVRLPFVNILVTLALLILLYYWIKEQKFKDTVVFLVAIIFLSMVSTRLFSINLNSDMPWLFFFPLVTTTFLGLSAGLAWNAAYVGALAIIEPLANSGLLSRTLSMEEPRQFFLALCFLSVLGQLRTFIAHAEEERVLEYDLLLKQSARTILDLAFKNNFFVELTQQTSSHVIITDINGRILFANEAASKLTGYTLPMMQGQTPRLWGGLAERKTYQAFWKKIKNGKSASNTFLNRRRDGELYQSLARVTPIRDHNQNVVAYLGYEEDVTDRTRAEEAKSEFVSLASHQLRTPLSTIKWYTELLESESKDGFTKKQHEYLHQINDANVRMLSLVNSLLNASRVDLGTVGIKPTKVNLQAVAQQAIDEVTHFVKEKKLRLSKSFDKQVKELAADQKIIEIVFQNLLSNAIKYTPDGGAIEISIKKQAAGTMIGKEKLTAASYVIAVKDSGCGIPDKDHEQIFTKLFRADNAQERDPNGTGLGLYIVKAAVDAAGGKISFTSKELEGSTFYAAFPVTGMKAKEGIKSFIAMPLT